MSAVLRNLPCKAAIYIKALRFSAGSEFSIDTTVDRLDRVKRMKRIHTHAPSPIMTTAEVARYLRIHPSTVYRLLRLGKLPGFKIGADYRFNKGEIDHWKDTQLHLRPSKK